MKPTKNKITVIGAGMVGSAVISSLLNLDMIAEIVVIDANIDKAIGESLDASHTTSFEYSPNVRVHQGGYEHCEDAQIIVITAGPSAKPGQNVDRLTLAKINVKVIQEIMSAIMKYTTDAIILLVTNPVDIITYVAQNLFDYPAEKIIGTGTLLDTGRFRRILAEKYLVDTKNVQGFILGEHGESAFATWSSTTIAGIPAEKFDQILDAKTPLDAEAVLQEVKSVGTHILNKKGYTNFGIATSVSRLVKAILLNELSILPVSTTLQGEYGIRDIALSVPCKIGSEGILKTIEIELSETENKEMHASAQKLGQVLHQLKLK